MLLSQATHWPEYLTDTINTPYQPPLSTHSNNTYYTTHPPLPIIPSSQATHWPEYLTYNLETDDEEKMQEIKNAAVPYNTVGLLEVGTVQYSTLLQTLSLSLMYPCP